MNTRKTMTHRRAILPATLGLLTLLAAPAFAQDAKLYDWPDSDAPALIASSKGLIFLHTDGKPYRAYKWSANRKTPFIVTDLNNDQKPDVVGLGKPTFTLQTNTASLASIKKGCRHVLVGNFSDDKSLEIFCNTGRKATLYTYNGQLIWEVAPGASMSTCRAGDINGDLYPEIECKRGRKLVRFDGSTGKVMDNAASKSEIEGEADLHTPTPSANLDALKSTAPADLTGDGNATEKIELLDGDLVIRSTNGNKLISSTKLKGKPVAALIKNLDGKGATDIIVVTDKAIHVIDPLGKKSATYKLNARAYRRKPTVDFGDIDTDNFSDPAKAKASIEKAKGSLAKCYTSELRKSQFAGVGRITANVKFDGKGKVKGVQTFTNLPSKKVKGCVKKTIKKLRLPAPKSGSDTLMVINLKFNFRDS